MAHLRMLGDDPSKDDGCAVCPRPVPNCMRQAFRRLGEKEARHQGLHGGLKSGPAGPAHDGVRRLERRAYCLAKGQTAQQLLILVLAAICRPGSGPETAAVQSGRHRLPMRCSRPPTRLALQTGIAWDCKKKYIILPIFTLLYTIMFKVHNVRFVCNIYPPLQAPKPQRVRDLLRPVTIQDGCTPCKQSCNSSRTWPDGDCCAGSFSSALAGGDTGDAGSGPSGTVAFIADCDSLNLRYSTENLAGLHPLPPLSRRNAFQLFGVPGCCAGVALGLLASCEQADRKIIRIT